MDPKFYEKNTLLHIVSRAARPEKNLSSIRPGYLMWSLLVKKIFLVINLKQLIFITKLYWFNLNLADDSLNSDNFVLV